MQTTSERREELEQLSEEKPADIRLSAMNYLARREHSLKELRRKLGKRYYNRELIEQALQRLAGENLQSDSRFAESYARQRAARGFGPLRIRMEMRDRGLSDMDVSNAFEEEAFDWRAVAREAYYKKYGGLEISDLKERSRRGRFMQYRGFSSEHYQHLLAN